MTAVMGNLNNGANCTMLQLGLNSPVTIDPNMSWISPEAV